MYEAYEREGIYRGAFDFIVFHPVAFRYSNLEYRKGVERLRFGAILKACRERCGLTQEQLAEKLHINQSDISKYENDVKEPTISLFQAWCMNTQAQEVLVAFICGMDGLSILQNITQILGGFILWF